jgi:hypothetical protein
MIALALIVAANIVIGAFVIPLPIPFGRKLLIGFLAGGSVGFALGLAGFSILDW